jgi:hypothetical protein
MERKSNNPGDTSKSSEVSPGGSEIYRYTESENTEWRSPQAYGVFTEEVCTHFEELFPEREGFVFHEILSDLVHIDVNIMRPNADNNFYVMYTTGMSDLPMTLPEKIKDPDKLKFAELFMFLPASWNPGETGTISTDMSHEQFWPIQLIKFLARFPHEYKTWLGHGHTIPNGPDYEPFFDGTQMGGAIVLELDDNLSKLTVENGQTVNVYMIVPATRDEIEYKLEHGMNALDDKFEEANLPMIIDMYRKSVV